MLRTSVSNEDVCWKELGRDFVLVEGEVSSRELRNRREWEILTEMKTGLCDQHCLRQ